MAPHTRPATPRPLAAPPGATPGDPKAKGPPPVWVELARLAAQDVPRRRRPDGSPPIEGKPPRFVSDPTLCARLCQMLAVGGFRDDACRTLGVSPAMFSAWMHRTGAAYRRFQQAVEAAESQAAMNHAANIARAAADDWKASAWWLERRRPEAYGRKDRVTVAGDPAAPLAVELKDVSQMTAEELDAYEARLKATAAAHAARGGASAAATAGRDPTGEAP